METSEVVVFFLESGPATRLSFQPQSKGTHPEESIKQTINVLLELGKERRQSAIEAQNKISTLIIIFIGKSSFDGLLSVSRWIFTELFR